MATQSPVTPNRPRASSRLSFAGSHKSRKSSGSNDLVESPKEKSARRMTTKADPNMAVSEAQPIAQALEKSTIENIRNLQHRDTYGNIIIDPDLSNPTRSRLERPLDTIRSFEAAIDGSYNRRYSQRQSNLDVFNSAPNRRSSYLPGNYGNGPSGRQRYPGDHRGDHSGGYYGNRGWNSRPESYADNYGNSQVGQNGSNRRFGSRNHSDPALYGSHANGIYPNHSYQQSYDTVASLTTASGSHGADPWSNSTNPSSENSSIDRVAPHSQPPKPDLGEAYGFSGFGGSPPIKGPILEEHNGPAYGQPGYAQSHRHPQAGFAYQGNGLPPAPPAHNTPNRPRVPIKLGGINVASQQPSHQATTTSPTSPSEKSGKRKSWLMRRFSKKE